MLNAFRIQRSYIVHESAESNKKVRKRNGCQSCSLEILMEKTLLHYVFVFDTILTHVF